MTHSYVCMQLAARQSVTLLISVDSGAVAAYRQFDVTYPT